MDEEPNANSATPAESVNPEPVHVVEVEPTVNLEVMLQAAYERGKAEVRAEIEGIGKKIQDAFNEGAKMGAAAVSAFLVAVGGSFYAQFVSYIDPESVMGFQFSLLMALPAVVGGIGTLWGPMLGAVILIPLTELTRSFIGGSGRGVDLIVYGGLIVAISLARPQGLVGLFSLRRKEAAR